MTGLGGLVLGAGFAATAFRTVLPPLDALSAIMPPLALAWLLLLAFVLWRSR